MGKAVGAAFVVILLAVGVFWWRSPAPALPAQAELGACDQQPSPPPLPATMAVASTEIAAIVTALDATLNDQHKSWLRCFTLDDEVLSETHHGFGRWLRTTLRLRQRPALEALGAQSPDEASSLITLVYAAHLRGQTLSIADARTRRAQVLVNAGVTR